MQFPPLLCCRRASLTTLRMLSSCASQNPNSTSGLPFTRRTISKTWQASHLPILPNLKISRSNPQSLHQSTMVSKSFASVSIYQIPSIPTSCDPEASNPSVIDQSQQKTLIVVSFYKFADFPDHADLRKPLKDLCEAERVSGGIILAPEGINGSICGARESVEKVLGFIQSDTRLKGLRQIESPVSAEEEAIHHGHTSSSPVAAGEDAPFRWDHVRVKLKKEIVSLGMPSVSPIERVGKYVSPRDWNALITDPDTVVIDVRNMYEIRCGKFKRAIDPCTTAFREFPPWVDDKFQVAKSSGEEEPQAEVIGTDESTNKLATIQEQKKLPRVAMYCTGGIRCEKASSLLLSKGFKEVYHLEGGILKYLEEIPVEDSLWEGECFVFDKRVSVEHGLVQGSFKLCYGCKEPVTDADMESPEWEYGVSCPYCFSTKSKEEKERARARQRQYKEWGIIGGPHKGRTPSRNDDDEKKDPQLSNSI